jgi:motility quorum-sensing regulator / GCU-specific mRNA interferase toxin
MEKRTPHYALGDIQRQMQSVADLYLTRSAQQGMRLARMSEAEALRVIQGLDRRCFYKSMTTYADHRVWQDVYHAAYRGRALYLKFQKTDEYFVVSFKERGDG